MPLPRIATSRPVLAAFAFALAVGIVPCIARAQASDARGHFHTGQTLYEERRFADALAQFETSLSELESPNTRLYIARCERELGHLGRAYRDFDRAAHDADMRRTMEARYEVTFRSASGERDALVPRIGFVVLRPTSIAVVSPPVLSANGEALDAAWGVPIALDPGHYDLEAAAEGRNARRSITIAAGETVTWPVELGTQSSSSSPAPTVGWTPARIVAVTTGSAGIAAIIAGSITGGVTQARFDQLVRLCGDAPCPASQQGLVAEGMALQTATNLLIGVGVTLAVGGGLGMLLVPTGRRSSEPRASVGSVPGGWIVSVGATF